MTESVEIEAVAEQRPEHDHEADEPRDLRDRAGAGREPVLGEGGRAERQGHGPSQEEAPGRDRPGAVSLGERTARERVVRPGDGRKEAEEESSRSDPDSEGGRRGARDEEQGPDRGEAHGRAPRGRPADPPRPGLVGRDHREEEELEERGGDGVRVMDRFEVGDLGAPDSEDREDQERPRQRGAGARPQEEQQERSRAQHPDRNEPEDGETEPNEERLRGGPAQAPAAGGHERREERHSSIAHRSRGLLSSEKFPRTRPPWSGRADLVAAAMGTAVPDPSARFRGRGRYAPGGRTISRTAAGGW